MPFDGSELYLGLAALHWRSIDFSNPGPDFRAFREAVASGGGPALEIGCGTGRLLLPFSAEGLDVDGVDISEPMIARCRERAAALGLRPGLYCQPMQALNLPRRYATIYIPCGSLVLIVDKREAIQTLRVFRELLVPSGFLVFNLFLPWTDLPAYPLADDPQWRRRGDHPAQHPDGDRIVVERRAVRLDPAAQVLVEERRYRLYRGDVVVKEELRQGAETWYGPFEIRLALEAAGFSNIDITGDYTGEPLSSAHREVMLVRARA